MSSRLTPVDNQILTVLSLECARTQGYLADRTGRSRQQIHTRLQILSEGRALRRVHSSTATYELITDPRGGADQPLVELQLINPDGDDLGTEEVQLDSAGVPVVHRYQWYDEDGDGEQPAGD